MYKPSYKYAVFDMDGTLLDDMYHIRTMAVQYLREHGQSDLADELHDKLLYIGIYRQMKTIQPLCEERGIPVITREDVQAIVKRGYDNPKLKEGVIPFLELLKQNGVKMCVMSTTEQHLIEYAIRNAGLEQYFEFVHSTEHVPREKRNPEAFEEVLKKFGVKAEETAMFEDSLHSIETAKQVGMYVVGIEDDISIPWREKIKELSDEYFVTYPV